tara:strand:+ start:242 stop:805 length:564 start_codon:yes stop_codon:yes gene_type:complete
MRIIIIIILSIVTYNISAQSFGLKGGLAMTNAVGTDVEDNSSRTGFYFGGFMQFSEGNNIQYMPQIIFHQKGGKTGSSSTENELVLNYIDLGMNAHFHINDEFFLVVGPSLSYLASAVSKNGSQSSTISEWDGWNRTEFGANLGAGYKINDLFHFNMNYGLGFTNVYDNLSVRNTSLQIGIGYVFSY